MKIRILFLVLPAVLALMTACQSTGYSPYYGAATGAVTPEDRVPLSSGQNSGTWNAKDLSVDYRYTKGQSDVDLSGDVRFSYSMVNGYSLLHDFRLTALFLDQDGKVLTEAGVLTQRGDMSSIPFRKRITVPASAAFMTFSYQGTAIESGDDGSGGGGGASYFWYYPVRR